MSTLNPQINTTYSDLALMIGGQILILLILAMIAFFGVDPITKPLQTLKENLSSTLISSSNKNK
jgi:hypothetical protein